MITAERLEELIKQGAIIYFWDTTHINLINLNNRDYVKYDEYYNDYYLFHCGIGLKLSAIFETKEQAEWALKTVAERTERFEPPMWEDIDDYYEFYFRNGINNVDDYFLRIKKNEYIEVVEDDCETIFHVSTSDVTKENYEKACEIVKDLFNRGNK